jgi:hypothetical protein
LATYFILRFPNKKTILPKVMLVVLLVCLAAWAAQVHSKTYLLQSPYRNTFPVTAGALITPGIALHWSFGTPLLTSSSFLFKEINHSFSFFKHTRSFSSFPDSNDDGSLVCEGDDASAAAACELFGLTYGGGLHACEPLTAYVTHAWHNGVLWPVPSSQITYVFSLLECDGMSRVGSLVIALILRQT